MEKLNYLKLGYDKVCVVYPILKKIIDNNQENIKNMQGDIPEKVLLLLKTEKMMRGIYNKHGKKD